MRYIRISFQKIVSLWGRSMFCLQSLGVSLYRVSNVVNEAVNQFERRDISIIAAL